MARADSLSPLRADFLRSQLSPVLIGREIMVLPKTNSTNDYIADLMHKKTAREGLVVFAEHQTAGRGQHGHRWESAAHLGLWFSIFLHPQTDVAQSARLTRWTAEAVARTIAAELSLPAAVRFPNDIYIEQKKVAGTLVEMRAQAGGPHAAIAGIGVNVNQGLHDFPEELRARATSLAIAAQREIDRSLFAIALLRNLDRSYGELLRA